VEEVAEMPQTLADLSQLQVETTDLGDRDATELQVARTLSSTWKRST
jgi:hypothetical protein